MSRWPDNYLACEQHSAEWFDVRCGRVTASRIANVMARLKNGSSSTRRDAYKMELLTEALTGVPVEHYVSPAMDWGITNEPVARAQYEMTTNAEVERIGFCFHPRLKRSGASPDGLVGDVGLVEIKCPTTATHLQYVLDDVVPEEHEPQMYWQMACAQRDWCDFVSYDPRLPDDFALFIKRLEWNGERIKAIEKEVETFISELNSLCESLKGRAKPRDRAAGPEKAEIPEWVEP